jgi:hypothetical protein
VTTEQRESDERRRRRRKLFLCSPLQADYRDGLMDRMHLCEWASFIDRSGVDQNPPILYTFRKIFSIPPSSV